ncbi:MAG: tetratricopeptide repeat protein [Acidobacteriaceae bacterium]
MSRAGSTSLGESQELSPQQVLLVREHLEEVLSSRTFAGSKRTQDFLRLIVRHTLEGDIDGLRERMIGAEMFGRPVSYDTGSDSVVRVRASEVRKKLALYYSEAKRDHLSVRIELPSGSYVPQFRFESEEARTADETAAVAAIAEPAGFRDDNPGSLTEQGAPLPAPQSPMRTSSRRTRLLAAAVVGVILSLVLSGYFIYRRWQSSPAPAKGIHSIAVLPFDNLSGDPAQDYFADGLTEELINDLGQVSTLRIISFTSSMSFKGTQKKLPEIARELNVDGVVEGGVLRDGNQVRISVQLIDAASDRPVWASTYVQDITSVFAWQGDVAQAIAEEISTKETPQEQARLARKGPVNPEAQDSYLHGLLLRNAGDCGRAVDSFRRAIEKSPGYAQAHSALASCYGMLGESGRMPYQEAFTQQKAEALQAIGLDDSLSEAHAELANTAMTLDWDWPAAASEFRRALQLNPNSATDHEKYAFYLVRTGHPSEAIAEIERSVDLDPVSGSTFHAEGFIYYFARQYDRSLAVTRTAQGLNVSLADWNFLLGDIDAEKRLYPEAVAAFLKSGDGPYSLGHLGNTYARMGSNDAARKLIGHLEENVRRDGIGRYEIALVYAGLGDKTEAFNWLDGAYRAHDVGLVYLNVDPCLDPLRSDARFEDLMRRIGLAQQ